MTKTRFIIDKLGTRMVSAAPKPTPAPKPSLTLRRKRPWSRKPEDRVPEWLPGYLLGRDRGCIPATLGAGPCSGRLTIEHVKSESMTGKRAPSDPQHTLLACFGHNTGWCLTSAAKQLEREYLAKVERAA